MTREETIKMLRREIECMSHSKCQDCILEKVCSPMQTLTDDKYIEAYESAIKALEQEPRTGHWITNAPQYDILNPHYICSECGNAHTRTTPYCEMCGAKMQEAVE